jgi:hypothetical protein
MLRRFVADVGVETVESRLAVGGRAPRVETKVQEMKGKIQGIENVLEGILTTLDQPPAMSG